MASHHHLHHPTPTPCCYTNCCCPPPPPDPHLHHHHHHPPPPQPHLYAVQTHIPQQTPHFQQIHFQDEANISALLRRIAALETALRRRSYPPSNSLRHAAAQTIQTHFRAFLLNRSRTLRQLKELASIKSQFGLLKSRSHFDSDLVYRKASALLVKLEAIQGCDPMIRDGKKSLSRDLNSFLDYIDGCVVERMEISTGVNVRGVRGNLKLRNVRGARKMDNAKGGGLKRVSEEKLRGLLERIDKLAVELSEEEDEETGSPVRSNLNSRVLSSARKMDDRKYEGSRSVNVEKLRGLVGRKDKLAVELVEEEEDEESGSPVGSDLDSRISSIARKMDDVKVKLGAPTNQRSVVQPKKRVSFAEDGKVFRLVRNREPYLEEEDCDDSISVDAGEPKDDICREVEIGVSSKEAREDEEDGDQSEDGGSSHGSEGDLRSYPRGKR